MALSDKRLGAAADQTPASMPASTTSVAAFNAARGQGQFGRYGFDGVSMPLALSAPMQPRGKTSAARGWAAKLYPSDFVPKSLLGKVLLAPLGLLMLAGAVFRLSVASDETESAPEKRYQQEFDVTDWWYTNPSNAASPFYED